MKKHTPKLSNVIEIDEARIRDHLGELVRGSVEDTLNALLDAEADQLCNATRYERTEARRDSRAGSYGDAIYRSMLTNRAQTSRCYNMHWKLSVHAVRNTNSWCDKPAFHQLNA